MNILEFEALTEGGVWTKAFAAAVETLNEKGGGVLTVPAGTYRSGPFTLCSHMTLHLETGATIRFLNDISTHPLIDMEFEGIPGAAYHPLLFADGAQDIRVTGGGTLDGNGSPWWQAVRSRTLVHARPYLMCFRRCSGVVVENVTLFNSPCWTLHPLYCQNVTVHGVTIRNPADSPNTDGINPNGCQGVRIADCTIDVGDDCIAIKAGTEDTPEPLPCENIVIENCRMINGHGGVVIGSEMSGGVRNVRVMDCVFQGTDRGIRLKTRRGRGGCAENLQFSRIHMDGVMCPFVLNMYYHCGKDGKTERVRDKEPMPVDGGTPAIRDVQISDVTAVGATACAGFAYGLPEMPIERLSLCDVKVVMRSGYPGKAAMMDNLDDMEAAGFFLRNVREASFTRVCVEGAQGRTFDRDTSVTGNFEA